MELSDHLRAIRKRWWTTLLALVLAIMAASALTARMAPVYTSTLTFYVSVATDTGTALQADEFAQRRINSYVGVMTSERLAERVIDTTGLQLSVAQVRRMISAMPGSDTILLDVTVSDTVPERTLAVAEAVAEEFGPLITRLEGSTAGATVNLTVISGPTLDRDPVSPRPALNLSIAVLVGLAAGFAAAIALERADRSVRSREQVIDLIGAPVLAEVPALRKGEPAILTDHEVGAPRAEAFRRLRTNLTFAGVEHPIRVLVVTSALAAEGKSTTALNLALALAEADARVLLVDADLRRPVIADLLHVEGGAGLTNVLAAQASVHDVVQPVGTGNLHVLTSGTIPPNPSEMLGSDAMRALVETARTDYDYVVIDTPPLLPVTDAAVVSRHADGVVIVTRYGRTRKDDLTVAAEALGNVAARVVGIVLNVVPAKDHKSRYQSYATEGRRPGRRRRRSGRTRGVAAGDGPTSPPVAITFEPQRREFAEPGSAAGAPTPRIDPGEDRLPKDGPSGTARSDGGGVAPESPVAARARGRR